MPYICYVEKRFGAQNLEIVDNANAILREYEAQGFTLTLRQLYYQFVARDLLANTDKNYKRLGSIINDARLSGYIDWNHLVDRTRNLKVLEHFEDAPHALKKLAGWYHVDMWANQRYRPEVWIEKDALVGIIEGVCQSLDVPYFSCRGYTSQSEMWAAGQRLAEWSDRGQIPYVIHLGDHDPSGIDMSRDIFDRLEMFMGGTMFERIALNMDQVRRYNPPPNPAKVTDSRSSKYIRSYGENSWELDALDPNTLTKLIRTAVENLRDHDKYIETYKRREAERAALTQLADNWTDVREYLNTLEG